MITWFIQVLVAGEFPCGPLGSGIMTKSTSGASPRTECTEKFPNGTIDVRCW
jgi:hypothetical protein